MKQIGTVRRIVREPDSVYYIWIPVFYSEAAERYHRALPDFLLPFKHYTTNVIKASEENNPDLDLFDFPSDSSRFRWHSWLLSASLPSLLVSYIMDSAVPYAHPFFWPLSSKRL